MSTRAKPGAPTRALMLREWTAWTGDLPAADAARLAQGAKHVLSVDFDGRGAIVIQPTSFVGRVHAAGFDLHIEPKVPVESLLAMLSEAYDLVEFTSAALLDEQPRIENLAVRGFLRELDGLLRQGLHRAYVEHAESLCAARGRIEIGATTDLYMRAVSRIACRFEEFTLDTRENRALLAALAAIANNCSVAADSRVQARRYAGDFLGVDARRCEIAGISALGRDVRTRHYRRALGLAELILRAMGFHERDGRWHASGFLVDMNRLFERVVTDKLTTFLRPAGFTAQRQLHTTLDLAGQVPMRPDLVLRHSQGARLIVDAKYKVDSKPAPADLYQMVAYCRAMSIRDAVLVDVAPGPPRRWLVRDGSTTIHALHVDLRSPEALNASVARAAEHIAALAGACIPPQGRG